MVEKKTIARRRCGTAKKAAGEKVKKGTGYVCEVCGLEVVVDEVCGCVETCDIICCGEPMTARKASVRTPRPKKAAVKSAKK